MYILTIRKKEFIQVKPNEIVMTTHLENVTKFVTIGEAMKIAAEINEDFDKPIVRVISYN